MRGAVAPLVINDAEVDEWVKDHPGLALYGIRAYVAVPLYSGRGDYFGTLCALDPEPSTNLEDQVDLLQHFGRLVAYQMAAEDAQRDRELLIATLSHDLRDPLNALQLQNEVALRDESLGPGTRRALERSRDSIRRMVTMTSEILDFTQIRSVGGLTLRTGIVDLEEIVQQVLNESVGEKLAERVQTVARGETTLVGDVGRLHQILQNLIGNALAHSPEGSPVTVNIDGRLAERVMLDVHNAGAMPTEARADLFSAFSGSSSSARRGYGLGLFIVAELVRFHGGEINVESESAEGTTFRVELPRRGRP